jgi:hypothetical protein
MIGPANCAICHRPLPVAEPVAFVDKQRVIHLECYQSAPAPRQHVGRAWPDSARRLARAPSAAAR